MTDITLEMTKLAYSLAKDVYHKRIKRKDALEEIERKVKMNKGSASDYISNFRNMMHGKEYSRTFNTEATDYILTKINEDYGKEHYLNAINSVEKHITYYTSLGRGKLLSTIAVLEKHKSNAALTSSNFYPDDIDENSSILEGAKKHITVNAFERSREARNICIHHHGVTCAICRFDFEKTYGEIGKGFIHVHHIIPIHKIGKEYKINPVTDLIPVCPNCHAMLHISSETSSIDEVKHLVSVNKEIT